MITSTIHLLYIIILIFLCHSNLLFSQSEFQNLQKSLHPVSDDVKEKALETLSIKISGLGYVYNYTSSGNQTIGLRFTNVSIPKNAVIFNAYIRFPSGKIGTGNCNMIIEGNAADNAPRFSKIFQNVSSLKRTKSKKNWIVPVLGKNNEDKETDNTQSTPDIQSIIQEIINRTNWNSGNAIAILIELTGNGTCTPIDEGSIESDPELIIEYTTKPGPFPVAKNSIWRFNDEGKDLGTSWKEIEHNDSGWKIGAGVLGYGNPVSTEVSYGPSSSKKHITYYFRHHFDMPDASIYQNLIFNIRRVDGAVVYLNGVEQFRTNMPQGSITYQSRALMAVDGDDETAYLAFKVPVDQLQNGPNVIAVSIHQEQETSSNLAFDMEVTGELLIKDFPLSSNPFPVTKNSIWKYFDDGANLGTLWTSTKYNHASWKSGKGVFGFGDFVATQLNTGTNSTDKHITYYFRHDFNVPDTAIHKNLVFNIRCVAGAVVYLNGVEQFRINMPKGPITFKSTALGAGDGSDTTKYLTYKIPAEQLRNGFNVIAVSVHQNQKNNSEVTFDMEVIGESEIPPSDNLATEDTAKIGCFVSIKPTTQSELLVYPDSHTFQQLAKSGITKYITGGTGTIPGGNDFTAYLPKNGSSKEGYLSINHENAPGGVSVLNINLNEQNMLWEVNGVHKMDFSYVAGTIRNCSGWVTPWGTIITSEETYRTGDADGDGYHDFGWNVEFDPVSGKIVDYNGDGKPEKLWAMGRMKHENVAIAKDQITVYQGEDGGTSCVYKYIANKKGDLSEGTLYVLKRNNSNLTLGDWIKVPSSTKSDRNNTSSIAGSLGGTNWSDVEGVTIGHDEKVYFASKTTGTIWRFKDNGSNVSEIEAWVTNTQYPINHASGTQMENFGHGVDNLVFDGEGNLWALQDDGRHHIWVIKPDHTPADPKIEIFATMPIGAEPTGLTFTPDYKYGFFSLQNPNVPNSQTQLDASGAAIEHNASITIVFARKEHLGTSLTMAASNNNFSKTLLDESNVSISSNPTESFQVKVYPNPFHSGFKTTFSLPDKSQTIIKLISVEGVVIRTLINDTLDEGIHSLEIDNMDFLQNGVYLMRMQSLDKTITKRIIHLKN